MSILYCPNCEKVTENKVIETRESDDKKKIVRRRRCMGCFHTSSTVEIQKKEDDLLESMKLSLRSLVND